ncbi:uncharacterized protein MONBRDRAFT_25546 [Monosiga brevicollis MX1]|uniref:Uncharacterized protein n=1 Tax=Monosiga brevicollis TaxID=81824 RepID=A9UZQ8_MONBE|nr:uncharacterized protein MONBRDRAFT_25546 [Monosiga brevicollis MX1]EDQ89411.1 predicted protein [Monosiga brevicollis MX1]|eukprot:XP_001745987.1 hypothetical protein [Monosiga brevicollis MX1]
MVVGVRVFGALDCAKCTDSPLRARWYKPPTTWSNLTWAQRRAVLQKAVQTYLDTWRDDEKESEVGAEQRAAVQEIRAHSSALYASGKESSQSILTELITIYKQSITEFVQGYKAAVSSPVKNPTTLMDQFIARHDQSASASTNQPPPQPQPQPQQQQQQQQQQQP